MGDFPRDMSRRKIIKKRGAAGRESLTILDLDTLQ